MMSSFTSINVVLIILQDSMVWNLMNDLLMFLKLEVFEEKVCSVLLGNVTFKHVYHECTVSHACNHRARRTTCRNQPAP